MKPICRLQKGMKKKKTQARKFIKKKLYFIKNIGI